MALTASEFARSKRPFTVPQQPGLQKPARKAARAQALKFDGEGVKRQGSPMPHNGISGHGVVRSNGSHTGPFSGSSYPSSTTGSVSQYSAEEIANYHARAIDQPQPRQKIFSPADVHDYHGEVDGQVADHDDGYDDDTQDITQRIGFPGLEEQAARLGVNLHRGHNGLPEYNNLSNQEQWPADTEGPPSDSRMDEGDADEAHATSSDSGTYDYEQDERDEEQRANNAVRARSVPAVDVQQRRTRQGVVTNGQITEPDYRGQQIQEANKDFHTNEAERRHAEMQARQRHEELELQAAAQAVERSAIRQEQPQQSKKRKDDSQMVAFSPKGPMQPTPEAPKAHAASHQHTLTHRGSSTPPVDRGPSQLSTSIMPQNNAPRNAKPTPKLAELDYPAKVLNKMAFDDLVKEDYDHDPTHVGSGSASKEALADRLHTLGDATHVEQQQFFSTMTMQDWQESGEWFKEQFANMNDRMLQSRKRRREIAVKFEADVATRYEAVVKETNMYSKALEDMNSSGKFVLEQGTPKRRR